jgi:hypothetical protein
VRFDLHNGKAFYRGTTTRCLSNFALELEVDENSILFHYHRGDFQKLIQNIRADEELGNSDCLTKRDISGEKLRNQLLR